MKMIVPHGLGLDEARRRVAKAATEHDLELEPSADGLNGTLTKSAPFLGRVHAQYTLTATALELELLERPALLPEGTLRRMIEDELGRVLAP
jgi:hypothetical protein